jgi:hypothetical protein
MHELRKWKLCGNPDCSDRVPELRDRFYVRQWLMQFKRNVPRMLGLRTLLAQEAGHRQLSGMSDEDVIHYLPELLVSGRLHAHALPVGEQARSVTSDGDSPQSAPFPLAARRAASESGMHSEPAIEQLDFPPATDFSNQAVAFCEAAETGKAFCKQCNRT